MHQAREQEPGDAAQKAEDEVFDERLARAQRRAPPGSPARGAGPWRA